MMILFHFLVAGSLGSAVSQDKLSSEEKVSSELSQLPPVPTIPGVLSKLRRGGLFFGGLFWSWIILSFLWISFEWINLVFNQLMDYFRWINWAQTTFLKFKVKFENSETLIRDLPDGGTLAADGQKSVLFDPDELRCADKRFLHFPFSWRNFIRWAASPFRILPIHSQNNSKFGVLQK